jgi:hypothetical protein
MPDFGSATVLFQIVAIEDVSDACKIQIRRCYVEVKECISSCGCACEPNDAYAHMLTGDETYKATSKCVGGTREYYP